MLSLCFGSMTINDSEFENFLSRPQSMYVWIVWRGSLESASMRH